MKNDFIEDMMCKKRDKICAIILSVKDKQCNQYLTDESSVALRKVVLDQVNDFCDYALDLIEASETDDILNELIFKIDDIHKKVSGVGKF